MRVSLRVAKPLRLGFSEIRKYQKNLRFGSRHSTQSPFQKLDFRNSSQKVHKSRYQSLLVLSNFTGFLYLVPDILFGIAAKHGIR